MTLNQLSKECGCDIITLRRWVSNNKILTHKEKSGNNRMAKAINEQDRSNFKIWWNARFEFPIDYIIIKDLAKECGVDPNTIRNWAKFNNIEIKKFHTGKSGASCIIENKYAEEFKKVYYSLDNAVAVVSLLDKHKCNWRAANRWAKRTGVQFLKVKSGGRSQKGLSIEDAKDFEVYLKNIKEKGYFYLMQLLPECVPGRIKFGFAYMVEARLASHRITCPNARLIGQWPCLRHKEKSTIKQIMSLMEECFSHSSEVYDCKNVDDVLNATNVFFLTNKTEQTLKLE
jgi:hypothetical protein